MNKIRYSINSLTDREEIFFRSIIVMYNSRNNTVWERDDNNFDVLITGKGYLKNTAQLSANTAVIISLDPELTEHNNVHIINVTLPIKATELIKNIDQAEQLLSHSTETISSLLEDKKVKLLRWPSASILAQDSSYPILSALLTKRAMTLKDLVSFSKNTEDVCNKYISLIIANNDAQYIDTIHVSEAVPAQKISKKSLLDRIKASLGLS